MISWTGVLSDEPIRMAGVTPAQALQQLLEKKWVLKPSDQDMIVMQHEIRYREQAGGNEYEIRSSLVETGVDSRQTAMARTVGLPLAMAAKLILENKISRRGCLVPVLPEIYGPVLKELEAGGLRFEESHHAVSLTL